MKISYNWLQSYFDKKLPSAKELADNINAHVFEVEEIKEVKNESGSGTDTMLDIKVMPDRAHYALCHKGIAREVRVITDQTLKGESGSGPIKTSADVSKVSVSIQDPDLCYRYVARRIENVSIKSSPDWLSDRLEVIDARPISSIVDATNYVMFDVGQPLHAFDADKVKGAIVVRRAKKNEKVELLPERVSIESDGNGGRVWTEKERVLELTENDLVIADDLGPLAVAGVKGGRRAEISTITKNIILESANFNPVAIRRTSTRLGIRNDSSKRFENEIVPELASEAMEQVTALITDMSPKAKVGDITDVWNKKTPERKIEVTAQFVSAKLGINVEAKEIVEILEREDCKVEVKKTTNDSQLIVTPPLDRLDLIIPEDISDEVARIKGYENIPSVLPTKLSEATPIDKTFYLSEKIKNILVSKGFSETLLYALSPKGYYEIAYPLASDKAALRESIVPKVKESLIMNGLNADLLGLEAIKIFEIGKVFPKDGERTVLTIGAVQVKKKKGVNSENIIKDILTTLSQSLGVTFGEKIINGPEGAVVEINLDETVSKISSATANVKSAKVSDLDITFLPADQKYIPFSPYPFITRDIAVFVPENISSEIVWSNIEKGIKTAAAEKLLARYSLFDTFKKDGKVSYAFRMVFQSFEKTLTDEEVATIMEKIYAEMKNKSWEVR